MKTEEKESRLVELAARLPIWKGPVEPVRLGGGITNVNFVVADAGHRYVVRVGDDIPVHQIMRFNERAASRAAHVAGISPEVVHVEPGFLVLRYVEGRTCTAADIRDPARLAKIIPLLKRVHREMPRHVRGPVLAFWVFHVIRDYAHTLEDAGSRHVPRLPDLVDVATSLELAVGPIDLVFGHNDLLAGNFIDDGDRVWLIDWDYAGFNSPLFDLANLAANSELDTEQEGWLLATYYGRAPDDALWQGYRAMKCASLLREAMWSMVSEIYSTLDFDYAAYTVDYMDRFARAHAAFERGRG
ncbi:MAG: phosphotransferase [Bauldia sp.]|nr:MAG: phosphotransferase [Bauldia sp.]MBZ0228139.1 phosphotransferase [Bauldia sp.]